MSDELKPCPFCGVTSELVVGRVYANHTRHCILNAQLVYDFQKTSWNTRPVEDSLRAKLAIAVDALEECRRFCNEFDYEPTYNEIENIEKALAKIK